MEYKENTYRPLSDLYYMHNQVSGGQVQMIHHSARIPDVQYTAHLVTTFILREIVMDAVQLYIF